MFTEWYLRPVKNRLPTSTAGRTYCLMPPLETRSNCSNKLKHGLYILCVRVCDQPPPCLHETWTHTGELTGEYQETET